MPNPASRTVLFAALALVVAFLPGTTSASPAPVRPPLEAPATEAADPIVRPASIGDLLLAYLTPDARAQAEGAGAFGPQAPPAVAFGPPAPNAAAGTAESTAAVAPGGSYFETRIVSVYGYPGISVMGELGMHDADGAIARAAELAAEYAALDPERGALAALHLIADVAQPHPQPDGTYLYRMPEERVAEYVEAARRHGVLLVLDFQVGYSDVLSDVQRLERFLVEPFVHVAIDPEFATKGRGEPPGKVIGTLDAPDVNRVQRYLAGLVEEHGLPPKILVLHQFLPTMLVNTEQYESHPQVEITIDMDGFGAPAEKIGGYQRYALADYAERAAFKLFFHWDKPLMTPADVLALDTPPDYIIYQ